MDETEAVPPREPFFAVGLGKLVLLGVSTLGLYQVVWLLMHWRHRRDVWGERINAGVRAIIVPQVFIFPLAYRMGVAAKANHVGGPVSTLAMAALWAVLSVAAVLAGAAPLAVLLLLIPLVLLQATANRVNRVAAPRHQPNTGLTTKNWLVIGCGSLVWFLVVASWESTPGAGLHRGNARSPSRAFAPVTTGPSSSPAALPRAPEYVEVISEAAIIYAEKGNDSVGTVKRGSVLELGEACGRFSAWCGVRLFSGEIRYIRKDSVHSTAFAPAAPADPDIQRRAYLALVEADEKARRDTTTVSSSDDAVIRARWLLLKDTYQLEAMNRFGLSPPQENPIVVQALRAKLGLPRTRTGVGASALPER